MAESNTEETTDDEHQGDELEQPAREPHPPITEAGVYPDVLEAEYHADPVPGGSLSSSTARRLLPPGTPAKVRYERDHPQAPTAAMNFGSAAHKLVLGAGPELVPMPSNEYRTKAARQARDAALAAGNIPVKPSELEAVTAMAEAIKDHPIAALLLSMDGAAEQTIVWQDPDTGVWCRALIDWLPIPGDGRLIVTDYKTSLSADKAEFGRTAQKYGYHQQADFYLSGLRVLGLADDDAVMVFIVQEKDPPYLVSTVTLDGPSMQLGAALNHWARRIWAECLESGEWPGYDETEVHETTVPTWALKQAGVI